jgi:hypothetical protein
MLDGGTQTNAGKLWTIDFLAIKENNDSFKDPSNGANYLAAYAVYGSGTGAYRFIQIATISEAKNTAVVVWNYFKIATNDDSSLIYTGTVLVVNWLWTTSTGTYNGTSTPTGLPYSIN